MTEYSEKEVLERLIDSKQQKLSEVIYEIEGYSPLFITSQKKSESIVLVVSAPSILLKIVALQISKAKSLLQDSLEVYSFGKGIRLVFSFRRLASIRESSSGFTKMSPNKSSTRGGISYDDFHRLDGNENDGLACESLL